MTPQERDLLEGLFERIRAASSGPRDAEAEAFIAQAVRTAPAAPYLLSQTVIVQEEALKAAAQRIEELQAQVADLERRAAEPQNTGFLGGLGKSLFGGDSGSSAGRGSVPPVGGRGYDAPPPSGARWTQQGQPKAPMGAPGGPMGAQMAAGPQGGAGGGSFLKGALGAAAGVAGGMLLANSLSGLFKGENNPLGISSSKGDENAAADKAGGESGSGDSGWGSRRDEPTPASYDENGDDGADDAGWDQDDGGWDDGQDV